MGGCAGYEKAGTTDPPATDGCGEAEPAEEGKEAKNGADAAGHTGRCAQPEVAEAMIFDGRGLVREGRDGSR